MSARPWPRSGLIKALGKGLLKIMSKMGVSTVASYTGAQIFEAVGLGAEVIDDLLRRDLLAAGRGRLRRAGRRDQPAARAGLPGPRRGLPHRRLETGGEYQWRREGEPHLFSPETVFKLQHATRSGREDVFRDYTRLVDDQAARLMTLRGLLRIRGIDAAAGQAAGAAGRGRAGHRDHEAVRDRGHVLRVDLGRGARDHGHRHEPDRRPVQHRRGRRGRPPVRARRERRPAAGRRSSRWPAAGSG